MSLLFSPNDFPPVGIPCVRVEKLLFFASRRMRLTQKLVYIYRLWRSFYIYYIGIKPTCIIYVYEETNVQKQFFVRIAHVWHFELYVYIQTCVCVCRSRSPYKIITCGSMVFGACFVCLCVCRGGQIFCTWYLRGKGLVCCVSCDALTFAFDLFTYDDDDDQCKQKRPQRVREREKRFFFVPAQKYEIHFPLSFDLFFLFRYNWKKIHFKVRHLVN